MDEWDGWDGRRSMGPTRDAMSRCRDVARARCVIFPRRRLATSRVVDVASRIDARRHPPTDARAMSRTRRWGDGGEGGGVYESRPVEHSHAFERFARSTPTTNSPRASRSTPGARASTRRFRRDVSLRRLTPRAVTTRRHRSLSRTRSLVLARAGPQPPIIITPMSAHSRSTGAKPASVLDVVARVNWAIPRRLCVRLARSEDATGVAIDAREGEQNDARAIVRRPSPDDDDDDGGTARTSVERD